MSKPFSIEHEEPDMWVVYAEENGEDIAHFKTENAARYYVEQCEHELGVAASHDHTWASEHEIYLRRLDANACADRDA